MEKEVSKQVIQCDCCDSDAHLYAFWGTKIEQQANLCRDHLEELWEKWGRNPDLPWTFNEPKVYK